jgi:hypothetical protein
VVFANKSTYLQIPWNLHPSRGICKLAVEFANKSSQGTKRSAKIVKPRKAFVEPYYDGRVYRRRNTYMSPPPEDDWEELLLEPITTIPKALLLTQHLAAEERRRGCRRRRFSNQCEVSDDTERTMWRYWAKRLFLETSRFDQPLIPYLRKLYWTVRIGIS